MTTKSELRRMARGYWTQAGKIGFVHKPKLAERGQRLADKAWQIHNLMCELARDLEELADK